MTIQLLPRSCLLSFFLFISQLASASTESLQAPQRVIENASLALLTKLEDPNFASNKSESRAFIDQTVFPSVDMVRMSALVLGKHWRSASKDEKMRFITAFKNLLVNTYTSTFTTQFQNWTIEYLPLDIKTSDKKTLVKTKVQQPGKPDAKIDYSMLLRNGKWKIFDIKIEGISLVISNRDSFGQMVKELGSLDAVISKLEAKNAL